MFMCACAGCDLTQGIRRVLIRTAYPIGRQSRSLSSVTPVHRENSNLRTSETFMVNFRQAYLVFRYPVGYNGRVQVTLFLYELDNHTNTTLFDDA